jgi:hypothetical protein
MADVIVLALVVICFAVAAGYAAACDRLLTRPVGKDVSL